MNPFKVILRQLKKLKDKLSTFLVVPGRRPLSHLLSASEGDFLASALIFQSYPTRTIQSIIDSVEQSPKGIYDKTPNLITVLEENMGAIIGDNKIHISEFVVAKVKGLVKDYHGHGHITNDILLQIPFTLSHPHKILCDTRNQKNKYLFIAQTTNYLLVVQVKRVETSLTEINTIFDIRNSELKRLEAKLPTVFSSGETPNSRIHASS